MKPIASTRRYFIKKATAFAISANAFRSFGSASSLTKPGKATPNKRGLVPGDIWFMNIALDHPKLVPSVLQVALIDKDPISGFTTRIRLLRNTYRQMFIEAASAGFGPQRLLTQVGALWDYGFKDVRGDQVHLVVSGTPFQLCSNDRGGRRWVITKSVEVEGRAVSWCLLVELRPGKTIEVRLTNQNTFDLSGHYDAEAG